MSDFEENDDFMCDDEEDYGLVRQKKNSMSLPYTSEFGDPAFMLITYDFMNN